MYVSMSDKKVKIGLGPAGFSLGLDDMEGDLSPPHMGGQVQGDKAVIGGDRWGGTYFMGGPILRIVFNPKR